MCRIRITQQDFVLKIEGGGGSVFAGHYGIYNTKAMAIKFVGKY